jgi:hypothetical protein
VKSIHGGIQMKELIGKTVYAVYKNEDGTILMFETDSGDLAFITEPDCCNSVWFEHLDNVSAFDGAQVLDVDHVNGEEIYTNDWEVLENWFIKIKTTKGYCTIEVRNSHNGYYGGSVEYYPHSVLHEDFEQITEDF